MRYFIIGNYFNQDGKQYATVVVKTYTAGLALWNQRKLQKNEFFCKEELDEITKEELDEMCQGDIWNQVEIIS